MDKDYLLQKSQWKILWTLQRQKQQSGLIQDFCPFQLSSVFYALRMLWTRPKKFEYILLGCINRGYFHFFVWGKVLISNFVIQSFEFRLAYSNILCVIKRCSYFSLSGLDILSIFSLKGSFFFEKITQLRRIFRFFWRAASHKKVHIYFFSLLLCFSHFSRCLFPLLCSFC